MDKHTATEEAYKNGYAMGYKKGRDRAQKHGRWAKYEKIRGFVYCSECKDVYIDESWLKDDKWHYCPNCGAKMDGEA